ncbi:CFEM domain-containing protein [Colletotrichum graminicola M1.001]|uniref:CFEM domain-containing protein n=1 Tax=Colletotrichum graminicola (strain M1.001 / M2 / FGSC 10212) TaxID=645133 RepID=E3QXU1_COLGM|nr:CFEM domain-containing protein [Colletotrichum graminicola M1.001]EFQ35679.1 CFEM domain-containing protein [Colletotrichum graminicola M1.001]
MKYSAAIIAFAGFAAAQTFNELPPCSLQCLAKAITDDGKCQIGNTACLCNPDNFRNIFSAGTVCVLQSCGPDTAVNQVIPAATRICEAAASSAVLSASSAVSAAASSAVVATSTRISAAASSAVSSAIGTIPSPITSAPRPGITRTSIVTSTVTTIYNGNLTRTTTQLPTTQVPVTVNGAAVQGPIGIAAAIALGALAYL